MQEKRIRGVTCRIAFTVAKISFDYQDINSPN